MKGDLSLMIFPILSTVFGILAIVAIWVPAAFARGLFEGTQVSKNDPVLIAAGLTSAYVSTFIAIFFNVALAACAVRSMRGEDTKVREGISAAMRRLGPIIGWTLVTTTVGLILRALEKRFGFLTDIAVWLAGAAWAIATFFVIPVVALEGTGPIQSLKRSSSVVKARWGEGATGAATIGVATFLISVAIALVGGVAGFALLAVPVVPAAVAVLVLTVVGIVAVSFVSSALGQIFRVAVYQYAVSGTAPSAFDGQLLQAAFSVHGVPQNRWQDPTTGRSL
ncbi:MULTISPECIES: DUF6159 family protein [Mycobacterium]|uniref:Glycerophosphoryl diester phosphodiesterase membrane domain-containing protein n=1 Tax=Mycobacterium kiyosense TaxID=2871094 RepID=A0A9P3Q549_9MYCO|nr:MULTISPECIES: DUF6159 family protein [Mycobacterium]BDB40957.1 hypothetical protein IWGMT90018_14030 [Mycobacterium kiyosense]BDE12754.1 hypothetical protein MKCMC460_16140 [Mycobacterium sp. 20KCMC460]GLB82440.1 hypothetical protein SRL2020028_16960 [Mycobacterium kiyosense]GLB87799.1 hypothetical protein SRL2020130_06160 [Mycobacterium kiyosense]GLB93957.1 hypothetical protein SRL2020226_07330 [Mycobacterium kiyosense]